MNLSKTVYSTLKSLVLPDAVADKKYSEVCEVLENYYRVKTTPTTAAFKFRQCCQKPSESVQDYANRLKRAAVDCNFQKSPRSSIEGPTDHWPQCRQHTSKAAYHS